MKKLVRIALIALVTVSMTAVITGCKKEEPTTPKLPTAPEMTTAPKVPTTPKVPEAPKDHPAH